MKTIQITVEKNFHCLNDDRFIMEKISHTIELDKDDDVQIAMNIARADIIENFKAAYPKVDTRLNFDEVVDYSKLEPVNSRPKLFKQVESDIPDTVKYQKIEKGTIEEQIRASKDLNELDGWKLIAKSNAKLQKIFSNREKELINEETK